MLKPIDFLLFKFPLPHPHPHPHPLPLPSSLVSKTGERINARKKNLIVPSRELASEWLSEK